MDHRILTLINLCVLFSSFITFCVAVEDSAEDTIKNAISKLKYEFGNYDHVNHATSASYFADTADRQDLEMKLDRTQDLLGKLEYYQKELSLVGSKKQEDFQLYLQQWRNDVQQMKDKVQNRSQDYEKLALEWKNQFHSWYDSHLEKVLADIRNLEFISEASFNPKNIFAFTFCGIFVLFLSDARCD